MHPVIAHGHSLVQRQKENRGVESILGDICEKGDINCLRPRVITVVSRTEWGAREPSELYELPLPVMKLGITFNTETSQCKTREECCKICRDIQNRDMDLDDQSDIAYNWLVGGDGAVYEGRGWKSAPNITVMSPYANFDKMIDVAYIGNFEDQEDLGPLHQIFVNWLRQQIEDKFVSKDFEYR